MSYKRPSWVETEMWNFSNGPCGPDMPPLHLVIGGWNSKVDSVLSSLSYVMCLTLLWTSRTKDFSLAVNTGSDSMINCLRWEHKPRSSLCTYVFHCTDSKDPDIHVLDEWMSAKNKTKQNKNKQANKNKNKKKPHTHTHQACTIHEDEMRLTVVGLKNGHMQKSHQKWWTPEIYRSGNAEEELGHPITWSMLWCGSLSASASQRAVLTGVWASCADRCVCELAVLTGVCVS